MPAKKDAFSRILRWYSKSDITLSAEEEGILTRWIHVDALLRDGSKDEAQIIVDVKEKFGVSSFTAQRDIDNAQQLFGRCRQVSKKYLLDLHRQNIERDLNRIRKNMFTYVDKDGKVSERQPDDKEITALAKMSDTYTKAVVALPDDQLEDPMPPPRFIFLLAPGQKIEVGMSVDEAALLADAIEDLREVDGVYQSEEDEEGN